MSIFFQSLSEIWPTAHQIKHFLSPYGKLKPCSYKTETRTAMYCMQIPGKTEGLAGAACLLNDISKGSHWDPRKSFVYFAAEKSRQKKKSSNSFPCQSDFESRTKKGIFSDCKSSSCFKWAGVKESTLLCLGDLTVLDQGEQLLHSSSNELWSRKKRQRRPVVSRYFILNSCPLISDV